MLDPRGIVQSSWAAGLLTFPCRQDKRPLTKRGFKDARRHLAVPSWWPLCAIVSGAANGIDCLDVDPEGMDWLARQRLPVTRVHHTRRGGRHLIFRHHEGMRCSAGKIADGVDIRADAGYFIDWSRQGLVVENGEVLAEWPGDLLAGLPMWKRPHVGKQLHVGGVGGGGGSSADGAYDAKAVGFRLYDARLVQPQCWPAVLEASGIGRTLRAGNRMDAVSRQVRGARVGERNRLLFWASCRFGEMIAERQVHPDYAVYSLMCDAGACRLSLDDGREACLDTIASGFATIEAQVDAARDIVVRAHNGGPVMGADE
jgi:hypothetical protein